MKRCTGLVLFLAAGAWAQQQQEVTRLELRLDPAGGRIRPMESVVLQVRMFGRVTQNGESKEGRIRKDDFRVSVTGGWYSKPFRYQGREDNGFLTNSAGAFGKILEKMATNYVVKDCVLYTAPTQPGRYRIEVTSGNLRESVEIAVDPNATPLMPAEQVNFGMERRSSERYRPLAEHWSPYVAQETWFDWKADALCRFDYDQDFDGSNNWDNLGKGSSQAYVYYAAMETSTHWFLTYNFFHARDYSDNCIAGTCHENDNEGIFLTIRKDGSPFGKLEAMETLAHNMVYSYTNDPAIRNGAHNVEGPVKFWQGTHPVVFLEAGGHGALGGNDKKSFFNADTFQWRQNTGITYVFRGVPERPRFAMDTEVGYELLSIEEHWWPKATDKRAGDKMFSAWYAYAPFGDRPKMPVAEVGGSFFGVKHGRDKAKPFWGWHDMSTQRRKILATGQWGADPAYGVSRNLTFPADKPVSLEYTYNPYLGVTGGAAVAQTPPAASSSPNTPGTPSTENPPGAWASGPGAAAANEGSCEVEVTVDGVAVVDLSAGAARWQTVAGRDPVERRSTCSGAAAAGAQWMVMKREGRGTVKLLGPGRVEVNDPGRGDALYRFEARWTRR
jgi:hypothetical protein